MRKTRYFIGILILFVNFVIVARIWLNGSESHVEIHSNTPIERAIRVEMRMSEETLILYSAETIQTEKKNINALGTKESSIQLVIDGVEEIIMGYVDANNRQLKIGLEIEQETDGSLTVKSKVKDFLGTQKSQMTFK